LKELGFCILVVLALTSCTQGQKNGILDNGTYDVMFDPDSDGTSSIYENYELSIQGTHYTKKFKSGLRENGRIEKIYFNKFILADSNERNAPLDSLSDFQKGIRHWGLPCFELTEKNGNTLKFRTTFRGQLHMSLNTGLITRR
jgi:hypothetical protein